MLLAIDAGNTHIVFAICDGEHLKGQWRLSTIEGRTQDEYAVWMLEIMRQARLKPEDIKVAILSSVVPAVVFPLKRFCKEYFGVILKVVGEEGVNLGVAPKIDNPKEAGADRLVNSYAAWKKYNQALIIIDFGTATTFDVVSAKGEYCGGVIAPGINLSLNALHQATAKLPNVEIAKPGKVIGTSTIGAMQSGIYHGYTGMIEGIVARIKQEYEEPMLCIATGGLARFYEQATDMIEYLDEDLTIQGLIAIHELNS